MADPTPSPNGPGQFPLQVGSVFFWTNEVPEELPIGGGEQMEATHQLIGGSRIVQTFGPDAANVSWSGRFFAANIAIRVQQLRLYMTNGLEILIKWKGEQYLGIVKHFQPHYHGGYAGYDIEIVVTQDQNGAFTTSSPLSIDTQVSNLFTQANAANTSILQSAGDDSSDIADPSNPQSFQQPLTNLQQAIATAGPIAQNITTAGPLIQAAATAASAAVAAYQATLSGTAPTLVSAALLQASVTAIGLNANRGQAPAQITEQGVSLFTVTARTYGDITQSYALAEANDLPSVFLSAYQSQTLGTPPFPKAA